MRNLFLPAPPPQGLRDAVKLGLKSYESLLAMGVFTKNWVTTALRDNGGHLLAEFRPSQVADIVLTEQDEDKIAIKIQKATKDSESTERLLAAEIIRYRRALRSHMDLADKMIEKYQEAQDLSDQLNGIIKGENKVGGADVLQFDMLQVP